MSLDSTDIWGERPSTRIVFQLRQHHKSRTNKKWLKRYGYCAFSIAVDQVDTPEKRYAIIREARAMSKAAEYGTPLSDKL